MGELCQFGKLRFNHQDNKHINRHFPLSIPTQVFCHCPPHANSAKSRSPTHNGRWRTASRLFGWAWYWGNQSDQRSIDSRNDLGASHWSNPGLHTLQKVRGIAALCLTWRPRLFVWPRKRKGAQMFVVLLSRIHMLMYQDHTVWVCWLDSPALLAHYLRASMGLPLEVLCTIWLQ